MSSLRKRNAKGSTNKVDRHLMSEVNEKQPLLAAQAPETNSTFHRWALWTLTATAFFTRFYKIHHPDEVVFDEVHFGKFASYYLERTYFFDLHPPFAKLLIAFVGYLVGYSGAFKFDNIGDSYIVNNVPYITYRSLSAILGSLTVPIVYLTLKELNYSIPASAFAALLVLFDNAHVTETRLILLDATLIIAVALSIYSYVKFYKEQKNAFTVKWWTWLALTGISLSIVISTKYVGVFTFITIGFAVAIDLWYLLDIETGLTIRQFARHFVARFYALIVLPFAIYLFWFYIHFAILNKSGPGDNFMSSKFQESLGDSPLTREAKELNYYDVISLRHKSTGAMLHSHSYRYPLRYEDGRVSSQGQQVTGFIGEDVNNYWKILPVNDFPEGEQAGKPVLVDDIVRFYHVNTNSYLLSHDVASPLYPTNEEITVVDFETATKRFNETLFKLQTTEKSNKGSIIKTKASLIRVIHTATTVALWSHDDVTLPDWAFNQLEVNGNKKIKDSTNIWIFDEIQNLSDERKIYIPKQVKDIPFFKKWWELQVLMFEQNNKLASTHPFASDPLTWPVSLSGVSFWTQSDKKQQIYFLGNLFGWWTEVLVLALFIGFFVTAKIAEQRRIYVITKIQKKQLFNIAFLYIGYLSHYVFFFLMTRQKFLHHYLPAHLIAALLTAAVLEFLIGRGKVLNATLVVLSVGLIATFIFFAPITYGDVSLNVGQVKAREFFNTKLHFSK